MIFSTAETRSLEAGREQSRYVARWGMQKPKLPWISVVGLVLSPYGWRNARIVLATDINPRALAFVDVNAAINGVRDVRTTVSDLFDKVNGSFDLITMQLPLVPNPATASPARYRYGASRGNELVLRAI